MVFTMAGNAEDAKKKFAAGFDGVLTSDTPLFMNSARSYVNSVREIM